MADSLSEQDREWVKAIVAEAVGWILNEAKTYTGEKVQRHARECPNVMKGKAMIFGMLLASSFGGGGFVYLFRGGLAALTKWIGGS